MCVCVDVSVFLGVCLCVCGCVFLCVGMCLCLCVWLCVCVCVKAMKTHFSSIQLYKRRDNKKMFHVACRQKASLTYIGKSSWIFLAGLSLKPVPD